MEEVGEHKSTIENPPQEAPLEESVEAQSETDVEIQ